MDEILLTNEEMRTEWDNALCRYQQGQLWQRGIGLADYMREGVARAQVRKVVEWMLLRGKIGVCESDGHVIVVEDTNGKAYYPSGMLWLLREDVQALRAAAEEVSK